MTGNVPIFQRLTPEEIQSRRARALDSVGLPVGELRARVLGYTLGEPTPDERDAWIEVTTCDFLLGPRSHDVTEE